MLSTNPLSNSKSASTASLMPKDGATIDTAEGSALLMSPNVPLPTQQLANKGEVLRQPIEEAPCAFSEAGPAVNANTQQKENDLDDEGILQSLGFAETSPASSNGRRVGKNRTQTLRTHRVAPIRISVQTPQTHQSPKGTPLSTRSATRHPQNANALPQNISAQGSGRSSISPGNSPQRSAIPKPRSDSRFMQAGFRHPVLSPSTASGGVGSASLDGKVLLLNDDDRNSDKSDMISIMDNTFNADASRNSVAQFIHLGANLLLDAKLKRMNDAAQSVRSNGSAFGMSVGSMAITGDQLFAAVDGDEPEEALRPPQIAMDPLSAAAATNTTAAPPTSTNEENDNENQNASEQPLDTQKQSTPPLQPPDQKQLHFSSGEPAVVNSDRHFVSRSNKWSDKPKINTEATEAIRNREVELSSKGWWGGAKRYRLNVVFMVSALTVVILFAVGGAASLTYYSRVQAARRFHEDQLLASLTSVASSLQPPTRLQRDSNSGRRTGDGDKITKHDEIRASRDVSGSGGFFSKMVSENRRIKRAVESSIIGQSTSASGNEDGNATGLDSRNSVASANQLPTFNDLALAIAQDTKTTTHQRTLDSAAVLEGTTPSGFYFSASVSASPSLAPFDYNRLLTLLVSGTQILTQLNVDELQTQSQASKAEQYRRRFSKSLNSLPHKGASVAMLFPIQQVQRPSDNTNQFLNLSSFTDCALYQAQMIGPTFPSFVETTADRCSISTGPIVPHSNTSSVVRRDNRWRVRVPYYPSLPGYSLVQTYNLTTSEERLDDLSSSACIPNATETRLEQMASPFPLMTRVTAQAVHLLEQYGAPEEAMKSLPTQMEKAQTGDLMRGRWSATRAVLPEDGSENSQNPYYEFTFDQLYRFPIAQSSSAADGENSGSNETTTALPSTSPTTDRQSYWYSIISTTNRWDALNEDLAKAAEASRDRDGEEKGDSRRGVNILYIVESNTGVVLASSIANLQNHAATSTASATLNSNLFFQRLIKRSTELIHDQLKAHSAQNRVTAMSQSDRQTLLATSEDKELAGSSSALRLSPTIIVGATPLLFTSSTSSSLVEPTAQPASPFSSSTTTPANPPPKKDTSKQSTGDAIYLVQAFFPYIQPSASSAAYFNPSESASISSAVAYMSDINNGVNDDGIMYGDDSRTIFLHVVLGPLIVLIVAVGEVALLFIFVKRIQNTYVKSLRELLSKLVQFDVSGATHYLTVQRKEGRIRRRRRSTKGSKQRVTSTANAAKYQSTYHLVDEEPLTEKAKTHQDRLNSALSVTAHTNLEGQTESSATPVADAKRPSTTSKPNSLFASWRQSWAGENAQSRVIEEGEEDTSTSESSDEVSEVEQPPKVKRGRWFDSPIASFLRKSHRTNSPSNSGNKSKSGRGASYVLRNEANTSQGDAFGEPVGAPTTVVGFTSVREEACPDTPLNDGSPIDGSQSLSATANKNNNSKGSRASSNKISGTTQLTASTSVRRIRQKKFRKGSANLLSSSTPLGMLYHAVVYNMKVCQPYLPMELLASVRSHSHNTFGNEKESGADERPTTAINPNASPPVVAVGSQQQQTGAGATDSNYSPKEYSRVSVSESTLVPPTPPVNRILGDSLTVGPPPPPPTNDEAANSSSNAVPSSGGGHIGGTSSIPFIGYTHMKGSFAIRRSPSRSPKQVLVGGQDQPISSPEIGPFNYPPMVGGSQQLLPQFRSSAGATVSGPKRASTSNLPNEESAFMFKSHSVINEIKNRVDNERPTPDTQSVASHREPRQRSTVFIIEGDDRASASAGLVMGPTRKSFPSLNSQHNLEALQPILVSKGSSEVGAPGAEAKEDGANVPCGVDDEEMKALIEGSTKVGKGTGIPGMPPLPSSKNSTPVSNNKATGKQEDTGAERELMRFAPLVLPSLQPLDSPGSSKRGFVTTQTRRLSAAYSHVNGSSMFPPLSNRALSASDVNTSALLLSCEAAAGAAGSVTSIDLNAAAAVSATSAAQRPPLLLPTSVGLSSTPTSSNILNMIGNLHGASSSSAAIIPPLALPLGKPLNGGEGTIALSSHQSRAPSSHGSAQNDGSREVSPSHVARAASPARVEGTTPASTMASPLGSAMADIVDAPMCSPSHQIPNRPIPLNGAALQRQSSTLSVSNRLSSAVRRAHMSAAARDAKPVKASFLVCEISFSDRPTFDRHATRVTCFASTIATCAKEFGGVVSYFTGDTVGITFNAISTVVKHEEAACKCGMAIIGLMMSKEPTATSLVAAITSGTGIVATTGSAGGAIANAPQSTLLPSGSFAGGSASVFMTASNTTTAGPTNPSVTMPQQGPNKQNPIQQTRVIISEAFIIGQRMISLARQLGVRLLVDHRISEATSYVTVPVDVVSSERYLKRSGESKKDSNKHYNKATVVYELRPNIKKADLVKEGMLVAAATEDPAVVSAAASKESRLRERNYKDLMRMSDAFALLRKGKLAAATHQYQTVRPYKQSKRLMALCQRLMLEGARKRAVREQLQLLKQQRQQQQLFFQQQTQLDDWQGPAESHPEVEFGSMHSDVSSVHSATSFMRPFGASMRHQQHFHHHTANMLQQKGKVNSFNLDAASFAVSTEADSGILISGKKGANWKRSNSNTFTEGDLAGKDGAGEYSNYRRREIGWESKLGDKTVSADITYKLFLLNKHSSALAAAAEAAMEASQLGNTIRIVTALGTVNAPTSNAGVEDSAAVSCTTLHRGGLGFSINSRFSSRAQSPAFMAVNKNTVSLMGAGASSTVGGPPEGSTTLMLMSKRLPTHPVAPQHLQTFHHGGLGTSILGASYNAGALEASTHAQAALVSLVTRDRRNSMANTASSGANQSSKSTDSFDSSATTNSSNDDFLVQEESVMIAGSGPQDEAPTGSTNHLLGGNMFGDAPFDKVSLMGGNNSNFNAKHNSSMALLNESINEFGNSLASRSPSRGAVAWGTGPLSVGGANNTLQSHSTPSVSARSNSPGAGGRPSPGGWANNAPLPIHCLPPSALGTGMLYFSGGEDLELDEQEAAEDSEEPAPHPTLKLFKDDEMVPEGMANDYDSQDSNNKSDDDEDPAAYWARQAQLQLGKKPQQTVASPSVAAATPEAMYANDYDSQDSNNKSDDEEDGAAYWARLAQAQGNKPAQVPTPSKVVAPEVTPITKESDGYDSQDSNNKSDSMDGAAYWAMQAKLQAGAGTEAAQPVALTSNVSPVVGGAALLASLAPETAAKFDNEYDSQDSNNKSDSLDGAAYWARFQTTGGGIVGMTSETELANATPDESNASLPLRTSGPVSVSEGMPRTNAEHTRALDPSVISLNYPKPLDSSIMYASFIRGNPHGTPTPSRAENRRERSWGRRTSNGPYGAARDGASSDRTIPFASPPITPALALMTATPNSSIYTGMTPTPHPTMMTNTTDYPLPYGYAFLPTGGVNAPTIGPAAPSDFGTDDTDGDRSALMGSGAGHKRYGTNSEDAFQHTSINNHNLSPPISLSENVAAVNAALFAMTASKSASTSIAAFKHPNQGVVVGVVPLSGALSSPLGDVYTNDNTTGTSTTPHGKMVELTQAFVSNCCSPSMPVSNTTQFLHSMNNPLYGAEDESTNTAFDSRRPSNVQQMLKSRQEIMFGLKGSAAGHPGSRRNMGNFHYQSNQSANILQSQELSSHTPTSSLLPKVDSPHSHLAVSPEGTDKKGSASAIRFDSAASSISVGLVPQPTTPTLFTSATLSATSAANANPFPSNPLNESEVEMGPISTGSPIHRLKHHHLLSVDTNIGTLRDNSSANFPLTTSAASPNTAISATPNTANADLNHNTKILFTSSTLDNSSIGAYGVAGAGIQTTTKDGASVVVVPPVGFISSLLGGSQHTNSVATNLTPYDHSGASDPVPILGNLLLAEDYHTPSATDPDIVERANEGNAKQDTSTPTHPDTLLPFKLAESPSAVVGDDGRHATEEDIVEFLIPSLSSDHQTTSGTSAAPSRRPQGTVSFNTTIQTDRDRSPPLSTSPRKDDAYAETPRRAYLNGLQKRSVSPRRQQQQTPLLSPQLAAAAAAALLPTTFKDTLGQMYSRTDREVGRSSKADYEDVPSSPDGAVANNALKRREGYFPYYDLAPPMINVATLIRSYLSINMTSGRFLSAQCFRFDQLQALDSHSRRRVEKEAFRLTKLDHDNLINIAAHGTENDYLCVLSQYVAQANLRRLLKEARPAIPFTSARRYLKDILSAVGYLHRKGVVHGCMRPECIVVDEAGTCKLGDFGIARLFFGRHATASSSAKAALMPAPIIGNLSNLPSPSRQQSMISATPNSAIPTGPSFVRTNTGFAGSAFNMSATSSTCATPRADLPLSDGKPQHGAVAALQKAGALVGQQFPPPHSFSSVQLFQQQQKSIERMAFQGSDPQPPPQQGGGEVGSGGGSNTGSYNNTINQANASGYIPNGTINSCTGGGNGGGAANVIFGGTVNSSTTLNGTFFNATSGSNPAIPQQAQNPYLSLAHFCDRYLEGSMVKYMSPEACAAAISIIDPSTSSHGTPSSNTAANQHYQQAYSTRSMNSNANINGGPLNNNDLATFSSQLERGGRFVSTDHIPITEDVGEMTNMNGYTTSAISSNNNVAHQAALPRPGLLTIDGVEVLNGSTSAGDSENESSSSAGNLFARNIHRGALSPLSPTSAHPRSVSRNDVSAPPAARSNNPLLASTTGIAGPQSPLFFSNTHVNGNPTSASSVSSNNAGGAGAANAPATVDFNTANPLTNQSNNSPATTPVTTRCTPTPIPIPTSPQLASTNNNPTAPQPFCLTAASDVYSIGIIFLEMVTGSHPWRGVSLPTVIPSNLLHQPFPVNPSFSAQSGPNSSLGASLTSAQQGSRKVPSSDYEYLGSLAAVSLMAGSTQHRASGTGGAVVAPKHPKSRQLTAHNT